MASWAYLCHFCGERGGSAFVSKELIDEMPPAVRVVRVKIEDEWCGAVVDRTRPLAVEGMLLRNAIASSEDDCPECAAMLTAVAAEPSKHDEVSAYAAAAVPRAAAKTGGTRVLAAAISLAGERFVVVAVGMDLVKSPGEADMAIEAMQPSFGGVPLVLMAQDEAGTPTYYGEQDLVHRLAGVPIEKMPWKSYAVG